MTNQNFYSPDFDQAKELLNDLFEEVKSKESQLSGGTAKELTRGATAIKRLQETQVKFTDPRSRLIPLTVEGFKAKNVELNYDIQQLMKRFDFYSLVVSVEPKPQPSVVISRLECQLDFRTEGDQQPIVHRIIPDSKWQTVVNAGIILNLGLDANLDVGVGVDASELTKITNLPDYEKFKANVHIKDEFKALIVLEGLNYQCGKFNLFAQGEDNSQCYWRIEKPEIQDKSTVKFDIMFKVPKGWDSIDLVGQVWIEPSIDWLNGELGDVIQALPSYLKNVFGSKDKAAKSFAVGNKEEWINLILPQAIL
ncbi:hypothetical protein [Planktothrix agardhii]|jgi:hypothetical protein|uniref:hypothetical protein n=1 Tax=Planktothrix agardhii TaxID=1160 RepID=UPI001F1CDA79|nr:hypothetical protein [Planktothrix agardhii]MCF3578890.1 hypothetical protein [Planktothrix agardhii 1812]MCF3614317.1 hypothetical protein [Planktothrix agardhii 1027]MCF3648080.1 hypothetical protein [Planktothrix agardhii 1026]CAD5982960.1 hypothetical protein NO2A_04301 [Planktothrix agardhii]